MLNKNWLNWLCLLGFWAFILNFQACIQNSLPLKIEEVHRRITDSFPEFQRDTSKIEVLKLSQNDTAHWFIGYNKAQAFPRIFMYHAEGKYRYYPPRKLVLQRPQATIENIELSDITYDGAYELIIRLRYDYDLSFQGREIIVLQNPFDTLKQNIREIFAYPVEQIWENIDTFDKDFGLPNNTQKIENKAYVQFYGDIIRMKGIIKYKKNHLVEYKWSKADNMFRLTRDEELHEATEEEAKHKHVISKTAGGKILLEVAAHEKNCRSYLLETTSGEIIDLPKPVHDALLCSPVTSLSDDGHFLIYTDKKNRCIGFYNLVNQQITQLVKQVHTFEGISEIAWSPANKRFGFVIVNPEEYVYNACIYIVQYDAQGRTEIQKYDTPLYYECETRSGNCAPAKDYDFRFNSKGDFVYRISKSGDESKDFKTLSLTKPAPVKLPKPSKK